MSDTEELKRNIAMMQATVNVVEVLTPFSPADRLRILAGAVQMGGLKAFILADINETVRKDPAIQDLLKKMSKEG